MVYSTYQCRTVDCLKEVLAQETLTDPTVHSELKPTCAQCGIVLTLTSVRREHSKRDKRVLSKPKLRPGGFKVDQLPFSTGKP